MSRLPYKQPQKLWEKVLSLISSIFINLVSMLSLIGVTAFIILSVYFMFTEDLIKFACSAILILTFVYVNKS